MYRPSILHCALMGLMAAGTAVSQSALGADGGWDCEQRAEGWHCSARALPTAQPAADPAPAMTAVPLPPRIEEPTPEPLPPASGDVATDAPRPVDVAPADTPGIADREVDDAGVEAPGVDAAENQAVGNEPPSTADVPRAPDEPEGNVDLASPLADMNDPNYANRALYPKDDAGLRKWRNCAALTFTPIGLPDDRGLIETAGTLAEADNLANFNDLEGGPVVLTGDAIALQSRQLTRADRMIVRGDPDRIDTIGGVRTTLDMISLESERGHLYTASDQGVYQDATYYLPKSHARGTTDLLELDGPYLRYLRNGSFTTCDPGSRTWHIETTQFDLDFEEGVGTARNATLYMWDIPILYSPVVTMPIDSRRRTGFITPSWVTSKVNGWGMIIPYYLNLAENYDATISARTMTERGIMGMGEFRYRTRRGDRGQANVEFLPDDTLTGDDRYYMAWRHRSPLGYGVDSNLEFQEISDDAYFNEFGRTLFSTSLNAAYLPRYLKLSKSSSNWRMAALVRDYQIVSQNLNPANLPYNQYPSLGFNGRWPEALGDFDVSLLASADHFARDSRTHGTRVHATPGISYPLYQPWGSVIASAQLFATGYDLSNVTGTIDESSSVVAPMFSVDGTVVFEREYSVFENLPLVHTIEPEAKITYIPKVDHSGLTVFDSNVPLTTRSTLKRTNRFTGADRIGDTFEIATGFDTRLLHADGLQLGRFGVTQVFYLDDRDIQRNLNAAPDDRDISELAADLEVTLSERWSGEAEWVWDPNDGDTTGNRFGIEYREDVDHVFDIGYRYRRGLHEHIVASTRWLLTPGWTLFAAVDYSPRADDFIENILGIEYDDCCIAVRVGIRDYKLNTGTGAGAGASSDLSIGLQIELKGFNFVGADLKAEQVERIPGVGDYDL